MAEIRIAPAHEIIIARTEEEKEQCFKLRIEVYIHEQQFPLEVEFDELSCWQHPMKPLSLIKVGFCRMESSATHLLLRLTPSLTPIGTIRGYLSTDKTYYKLSRLVVLKEYRQFKFGRELVLALHDWALKDAKESGTDQEYIQVVCHSQVPVKGFYSKCALKIII